MRPRPTGESTAPNPPCGSGFPCSVAVAAFFSASDIHVRITRPIVAVIEADAAARRMLCSLLSSLDAEIQDYDSAESYLAAESTRSAATLGCVITDMLLPGMSGLDLLRKLRSRRKLRRR